jgi:hypothetical protein
LGLCGIKEIAHCYNKKQNQNPNTKTAHTYPCENILVILTHLSKLFTCKEIYRYIIQRS